MSRSAAVIDLEDFRRRAAHEAARAAVVPVPARAVWMPVWTTR